MRIGVDLGGTKIEAIALAGESEARRRIPTPRTYTGTLDAITRLVSDLESEARQQVTVGIGIPGVVSRTTGLVKNANSTWLIGHPLQADLEARLDRPVRVANDANCFALSEAVDGAGRDYDTVFGVILGTGVGGGIVIRKQIHDGPNQIAGEWGHNPLPWMTDEERAAAPLCYCGKTGCIETFLSGPGFERECGRSSREVVQGFARARSVPCVHGALAPDGLFGRVVWDEQFAIDGEPAEGAATCEDGAHLPFIGMVAATLARSVQEFLLTGEKLNFAVHARSAATLF